MEEVTRYVNIELIDEPDSAMRTGFDPDALNELTESIKQHGILQPLILRPKGDRFEVIAGHRRLVAAGIARLGKVPALIRHSDDRNATILRVHENLVRENVDPVSEAVFIARTITQLGITQEAYAEMIRKSPQYVEQRLRIAEMPRYMQEAIMGGGLTLGAALSLFEIGDEKVREDWTRSVVQQGGGVRAGQSALHQWRNLHEEWEKNETPVEERTPPLELPPIVYNCEACGRIADARDLRVARVHRSGCGSVVEAS